MHLIDLVTNLSPIHPEDADGRGPKTAGCLRGA